MIVKIYFIIFIFLYLCVWLKYRERYRFLDAIAIMSFLMYICLFASITLLSRIGSDIIETSLVPLCSYYGILTKGWDGEGLYIAQSLMGNVILFMPLGLLLAVLFREKKYKFLIVILSAFVVSLSIEIIQFSFSIGTFEVDDLIHNTLGAVFGLLIADCVDLIDLHNKDTFYRVSKKLTPLFVFCCIFGAVCMASIIKLWIVQCR
ncbi:MAG: VanZ family protein [Ruminococcus sp.]|nr:VanZ family protein [Ruminococcus sp.]